MTRVRPAKGSLYQFDGIVQDYILFKIYIILVFYRIHVCFFCDAHECSGSKCSEQSSENLPL